MGAIIRTAATRCRPLDAGASRSGCADAASTTAGAPAGTTRATSSPPSSAARSANGRKAASIRTEAGKESTTAMRRVVGTPATGTRRCATTPAAAVLCAYTGVPRAQAAGISPAVDQCGSRIPAETASTRPVSATAAARCIPGSTTTSAREPCAPRSWPDAVMSAPGSED